MALKPKFEAETSTENEGDIATAAPATTTTNNNNEKKSVNTQTATASIATENAAVQATTAIAVAQTRAVATEDAAAQARSFQKQFQAMRGAGDFSYGNYDVYKGSQGAVKQTGQGAKTLGRWTKVALLSWDDSFVVSPGSKDKTSDGFMAYSKDGVTIDMVVGDEQKSFEGKSVGEYVDYLRDTEGFDKASRRRYVNLGCYVLGADHAKAEIGETVQITLSESSIPTFSKYQEALINKAKCVAMGLPGASLPENPFMFFVIAEAASKGGNDWTKLRISATLPSDM